MNFFPEKRSFAKSICAFSIAAMIVISSLMSVAAAITAPNDNSINAGDNSDVERHYSPMPKSVVLDIDGKTSTESFQGGTVAEFLEATETKVGENQIVIPSLSTVVADGTTVYVRTAKPVQVTDGGKTKLMVLSYGTVSEALALAGTPLGDEDILSVKRDAKIETLDKFTIQRVTYQKKTETVEVPFESETKNSDEVELGETKLAAKGQNGEKQVVKNVKYIDGKAVSETVVSEKVTKKPVNEVTLVGTKGAASTGGAGTFTDSNGVTVAYKQVLTGSGTAYTAPAGASTATGVPAYHGGVAIDPNLIPYGSKLYVESVDGSMVYGYCAAVDTGGFCDDGSAVIDVFYDTYDECVNWGRRDVNVYVIE